jgi:catechol 2,3-dioxygenase-like lactoylglutathione lyase family enzyme
MAPRFAIGEINVICTDIAASLRFYRDVLGFAVIGQEGDCYHLDSGGRHVLLLPVAAEAGEDAPYCSLPTVSVDLMVEDIEAAFRHLKASGVVFEREWTPGARSFLVRDPDGLVWEVIGSAAC